MKTWIRSDEWMQIAACDGSIVHTAENPTDEECELASAICRACRVRPECIQWAITSDACSVFAAGVYLPDPRNKKELKQKYQDLEKAITIEKELRGEDI